MKIFYVIRPFCSPAAFNVIADSKEEAIKISHDTYGFCSNTVAEEVKIKKGVLQSCHTYIG